MCLIQGWIRTIRSCGTAGVTWTDKSFPRTKAESVCTCAWPRAQLLPCDQSTCWENSIFRTVRIQTHVPFYQGTPVSESKSVERNDVSVTLSKGRDADFFLFPHSALWWRFGAFFFFFIHLGNLTQSSLCSKQCSRLNAHNSKRRFKSNRKSPQASLHRDMVPKVVVGMWVDKMSTFWLHQLNDLPDGQEESFARCRYHLVWSCC